jgi:hypothetical protein
MTGKTSTDLSSVLPLNARTARIASGGGLAASLRKFPAKENEARNGYRAGLEPDELDSIAPHSAENRMESSLSVLRPSVQSTPHLNSNPI